VEQFFEALTANADWLTTTTPSDWLAVHPPVGRAYIPTGSYVEMGEWALPADESTAFSATLHRAQADGRPEARWLRGASWRNFQIKYREVNDLHKRMLRVSALVDRLPTGPDRERALEHLYRGQSNDCYWHGLFGGVYLTHMRLATHEHLIAAEDVAETALGQLTASEIVDLDLDGVDEVRLADPGQVVTVDLREGAGIGAWDIRAVRHALVAVMRRRPEADHATLRAIAGEMHDDPTTDGSGATSDVATSIHHTYRLKEAGLVARLVYDPYERRSGLIRALDPSATPAEWAAAQSEELADAVDGAFEIVTLETGRLVVQRDARIAGATVRVVKTVLLGGDRRSPTLDLTVALEHTGGDAIEIRVGLESATMLLGGGGNPQAWWRVGGETHRHDTTGEAVGILSAAQGNDQVGIALHTMVDEPATLWWAPIETISNSEDGFERVYQGSAWLLSWPLRLGAGERWERTVRQLVTTTHDRTAAGL
jgi:alpha-amylase